MTLRRVLLALYSLLFIAACGGLIALTWNENEMLDLNVGDFNLQAFVAASDTAQVVFTTILAVLIVFGLWTLFMAFLPTGQARGGMLRLKQAQGGTVEVSSQSLESLVRSEIEALSEVRQAVPRVRVAGGSVAVDATVVIEPSANIANVTGDVNDAVKRALREQVGVTDVKRPNIRISYDTIKGHPVTEGRRFDATRPVAPPAPAATDEERPADTVSWPPPPPDMRAAPSEEPATEAAVAPAGTAAPEGADDNSQSQETHD
ncbi:MAG TPA: alkaline shock response membrane anchor protein AmaP [Tepidiformaceae bacterium]|nr:alkaline shock response membrane anchor protein AmaP [Tepidiformaceae bacterium]